MISKKTERNIVSITNRDFVLISLSKPIMIVKHDHNEFIILYLTQDKHLKKKNKSILFKEYLAGASELSNLKKFLDNQLSVLNFLNTISRKKRIVKANKRTFPSEQLDSFYEFKEFLPTECMFLNGMPKQSDYELNKLKNTLDFALQIEKKFLIQENKKIHSEVAHKYSLSEYFINDIALEEGFTYSETFNNQQSEDTFNELQFLPLEF
ncbi:Uncharacterised protein [Streptococcus pneumoniae]|nr:Uncharacterised protein [Streptococcus pneumoniae]VTE88779.1 Uncharacterised protein [Streptococcus pneumoniae]